MAKPEPQQYKPIYTDEKAVHLIEVFGAIVAAMGLVGWMQVLLLKPMKADKISMMHMDPSEIIEIPFSLQRLTAFTMFPAVINMLVWLIRTPQKMMSNLLSLTKLTLVTYALFGFCGAHIVTNYKHSATAALYIATLASTTWTGKTTSNLLEELPFTDHSNLLATCRLYGMLLVSVPFQVLNVLDRGVQIQRWPIAIMLGGTYGFVIGTLLGITFNFFKNRANDTKTAAQKR